MKRPPQLTEGTRFNGQLRHYHRSGPPAQRSWDEWVDGESGKSGAWVKWFKIAAGILSLLALGAIVAGLVMALQ
jgi:hypothetical protein